MTSTLMVEAMPNIYTPEISEFLSIKTQLRKSLWILHIDHIRSLYTCCVESSAGRTHVGTLLSQAMDANAQAISVRDSRHRS